MSRKPPPDPEVRKKRQKRRLVVYSVLIGGTIAAYNFQPIEIDFIPRRVPTLKPIDPDLKRLFSPGAKVMVVCAHPDDSEFYIAGTLLRLKQAGAELKHLLLTDGDKAYYFWADNRALRATRQAEQRQASSRWGAKEVRFIGLPDGRLRADDKAIGAVAKAIRDWNPDTILGFDGMYPPRVSHQDHRRAGDVIAPACREAAFTGWVMHFGTQAPTTVIDVDPVWSERVDLLAIHASQFSGEKLKRIQAFIADSAANQGESKGYSFAESFRAVRYAGGIAR